jgi:cytochrome c oxidase subunit 4
MSEHVVPIRVYAVVLGLLLFLTALTTAVAYVDLGPANVIVMLVIAVIKATLVVLFFMHVRYATRLTWLVVGCGFAWLLLLVVGTASDEVVRLLVQPSLAQDVVPPRGAFDTGVPPLPSRTSVDARPSPAAGADGERAAR